MFSFVGSPGANRPIVATSDQFVLVEDSKFVVHMLLRVVDTKGNPVFFKVSDIATSVLGFEVIGENADLDPALMGFDKRFGDLVIGDGEDTNIHFSSRIIEEADDLLTTSLSRAKEGLSCVLGERSGGEIQDLFEPLEHFSRLG